MKKALRVSFLIAIAAGISVSPTIFQAYNPKDAAKHLVIQEAKETALQEIEELKKQLQIKDEQIKQLSEENQKLKELLEKNKTHLEKMFN